MTTDIINAKKIRDENINLVGKFDNVSKCTIIDVIVEPADNNRKFIDQYLSYHRQGVVISNDKMLEYFPSKDYRVSAILDYDENGGNLFSDDVALYKHLISGS